MKARTIPSDEALVARARAGDYSAFEELVDRYEALVYSFAQRAQQDPGRAEELTLSAFVNALEHLAEFGRPANFGVWLLAIAARETRQRRARDCFRVRL